MLWHRSCGIPLFHFFSACLSGYRSYLAGGLRVLTWVWVELLVVSDSLCCLPLLCFTQFPGLGSCTYVSGVSTWRPPVPQKGSVRVASFVISGPLNSCHRCWLVFNHSWLCLEWDPFSYHLGNRTWFYFTIVLSWSGWMLGLRRINTESVVFLIKLYVYKGMYVVNIHLSL